MPTINAKLIYTIAITDKSIGSLCDSIQKLLDAGLPPSTILSNTPDVVILEITDQNAIDKITKALGRVD